MPLRCQYQHILDCIQTVTNDAAVANEGLSGNHEVIDDNNEGIADDENIAHTPAAKPSSVVSIDRFTSLYCRCYVSVCLVGAHHHSKALLDIISLPFVFTAY